MNFIKILLILRNFFDFLRSEKSFSTAKMVSQKVSHHVSFHREGLWCTSFSTVGNQTSFLRNLGFAGIFLPQLVSQKVSHLISFHTRKLLPNWSLHSFQDRVLVYQSAKPAQNQNGMEKL